MNNQKWQRGKRWLNKQQLIEYNLELTKAETPKEDQKVFELREKYKEKFGKDVANAYKNQIEWMEKKLLE